MSMLGIIAAQPLSSHVNPILTTPPLPEGPNFGPTVFTQADIDLWSEDSEYTILAGTSVYGGIVNSTPVGTSSDADDSTRPLPDYGTTMPSSETDMEILIWNSVYIKCHAALWAADGDSAKLTQVTKYLDNMKDATTWIGTQTGQVALEASWLLMNTIQAAQIIGYSDPDFEDFLRDTVPAIASEGGSRVYGLDWWSPGNWQAGFAAVKFHIASYLEDETLWDEAVAYIEETIPRGVYHSTYDGAHINPVNSYEDLIADRILDTTPNMGATQDAWKNECINPDNSWDAEYSNHDSDSGSWSYAGDLPDGADNECKRDLAHSCMSLHFWGQCVMIANNVGVTLSAHITDRVRALCEYTADRVKYNNLNPGTYKQNPNPEGGDGGGVGVQDYVWFFMARLYAGDVPADVTTLLTHSQVFNSPPAGTLGIAAQRYTEGALLVDRTGLVAGVDEPTLDNTGILYNEATLTAYIGSRNISSGTTIENKIISGTTSTDRISIYTTETVTFRNCLFDADGWAVAPLLRSWNTTTADVHLIDCTFRPDWTAEIPHVNEAHPSTWSARGASGHGLHFLRCQFYNCSDGLSLFDSNALAQIDSTVEQCWFGEFPFWRPVGGLSEGLHNDGIQIGGGDDLVIRGNAFWGYLDTSFGDGAGEQGTGSFTSSHGVLTADWNAAPDKPYINTACILMKAETGYPSISGLVIDKNWFRGSSVPLNVSDAESDPQPDLILTNNIFGTPGTVHAGKSNEPSEFGNAPRTLQNAHILGNTYLDLSEADSDIWPADRDDLVVGEDKPNLANTGVLPWVTRTELTGHTQSSMEAGTYTNKDIEVTYYSYPAGGITLTSGRTYVFNNCKFYGVADDLYRLVNAQDATHTVVATFTDCTFELTHPVHDDDDTTGGHVLAALGIQGHHYTLTRCQFRGFNDATDITGITGASNVTIEQCYIDNFTFWRPDGMGGGRVEGTHNDGVVVRGGTGSVIRGNTIHGFNDPTIGDAQYSEFTGGDSELHGLEAGNDPEQWTNGVPIFVRASDSSVDGTIIDQNWLTGGQVNINVSGSSGTINSLVITDNIGGNDGDVLKGRYDQNAWIHTASYNAASDLTGNLQLDGTAWDWSLQ